jgi:predicted Fe-S protein YdhL (DUF1289 family)
MTFDRDGWLRCRVCGCTDREPCVPPCSWVDGDLCSRCLAAVEAILEWREGAHRANWAALFRELRPAQMLRPAQTSGKGKK